MDDMEMAFPWVNPNNGNGGSGMTLRQWYAGQALAGIMANPERWRDIQRRYDKGEMTYDQASEANATKALSLADAMIAMIAERDKEQST